LIAELDTKFAIVSYNSDGFISKKHMLNILRRYGTVNQKEIVYNTYKGGRNLSERDLYVKEYLFILEKGKNNE
jgi:adenine-specific DNA-methyltransferase